MITTKKITSPVAEAKTETPSELKFKVNVDEASLTVLEERVSKLITSIETLHKLAGEYDKGHGAPDDKTPHSEKDTEHKKEEEVPGVPGTKAEEDDTEECTCEKCGSKYKAKKSKETDSTEKKENYDDRYVAPKAEDKKAEHKAFGLDFGKHNEILKPSKEDLEQAKSVRVDMNALFQRNKPKALRNSFDMVAVELERLTPKQ